MSPDTVELMNVIAEYGPLCEAMYLMMSADGRIGGHLLRLREKSAELPDLLPARVCAGKYAGDVSGQRQGGDRQPQAEPVAGGELARLRAGARHVDRRVRLLDRARPD